MKLIAKAIIKVMKDVKGMEKNSHVGSGRNTYNGTKDQDVKEVFNEAFAKNGLCIMPIEIYDETQIDRWTQEYNGQPQQKQSVFTKVKVKYLLLHESGESVELMGYGHGVDPQDKGAGKATTYALKNCLLYTFLTPVGKIDDTETTHSEEIQTPKATTAKVVQAPKEPTKPKEKKQFKKGGFEQALRSSQKSILTVLDTYELTDEQEIDLTEQLKTAK